MRKRRARSQERPARDKCDEARPPHPPLWDFEPLKNRPQFLGKNFKIGPSMSTAFVAIPQYVRNWR
jgi:hypothetical protein